MKNSISTLLAAWKSWKTVSRNPLSSINHLLSLMWRAKEFTNDRCCHRIYLFHKFLFSLSATMMDNHVLFPEWWQFLRKIYNCCPWRLPVSWSNVKIYLYACIKHLSLWYLSTLHGLKMNSEAAWRIVSKIDLSFGFCDIMWFHWVDRGTQRNIRHFTKIWKKKKLFLVF